MNESAVNPRAVRRVMWYLAASVACFWASLIVCYWLIPTDWRTHGISHYGNFRASIVPYAIGLISSAAFMALGAETMPAGERNLVVYRRLLTSIAGLLVALLLTPTRFGIVVGSLHTAVGATLFICQLFFSLHLVRMARRSWIVAAPFSVQFVGSLVTLMSLWHVVPWMLAGQLMSELGFGLLLVAGTAKVLSRGAGSPGMLDADVQSIAVRS